MNFEDSSRAVYRDYPERSVELPVELWLQILKEVYRAYLKDPASFPTVKRNENDLAIWIRGHLRYLVNGQETYASMVLDPRDRATRARSKIIFGRLVHWRHFLPSVQSSLFEMRIVNRVFDSSLRAHLLSSVSVVAGNTIPFNVSYGDLPIRHLTLHGELLDLVQFRNVESPGSTHLRVFGRRLEQIQMELALLFRCRDLKSLDISSYVASHEDLSLTTILGNYRTYLDHQQLYKNCKIDLQTVFASRGRQLRAISLSYNPGEVDVYALIRLLKHCTQLKQLTLDLDNATQSALRRRLDGGKRSEALPLYGPEMWCLSAILQAVGSRLSFLKIPVHGHLSIERTIAGQIKLNKDGTILMDALRHCPHLETLVLTSALDCLHHPERRGRLSNCSVQDLIEPLTELRELDIAILEITLEDFKYLLHHPTLEFVQLGYGVPEGTFHASDFEVVGSRLYYDAASKLMVIR